MTLPEQAGRVASDTVEALKGNPSCLAAIVLAGIFAVLTFFALQRDADRRSQTVDLLMTRCFPYIEDYRQNHQLPGGRAGKVGLEALEVSQNHPEQNRKMFWDTY